ncbi:hypothetical protein FNV43_RR13178 [Rhamnella rubrinervis]|uniref:Uncharacterized protein n=1 Tax=Rhamnella rubrinervis TaxID=2594499 RepID=A0A8K0MES5_9ROSA|nr:hypothetical protein FNV43_RR13178 [Rhamnella rubrinervis]
MSTTPLVTALNSLKQYIWHPCPLEACKTTGQIKRFIHVSTDEVYGETEEDAVVGNHEASQLLPTNPYSATKAGAEMLVMAYGRSYGLPVITTRGNNVYGPNQFPEKLIPKFILLAMKGKTLPIHGDGSNVRSYLYCEDVAEAFEVILHKAPRNNAPAQKSSLKFLIYGRTGWIGGLLGKICDKQGIPYEYGRGRLQERSQLLADIQTVKPTHVFNAAGVTGRPNVDWCETHKPETIRTNVVGTLTLADVCREHGLLVINYATGCIFEFDDAHPLGSGIGFKEEDTPNFTGSFYSKTKAMVEELLKEYDNVCTLRVRMPISSDLSNPRNFITKISRYNKVVNIPNSMTILDELLPISVEMAKRNCRGIWNFTNPGVVSHNEILEMYKKYIDPSFNWVNFTLEEQAKVIVAPRSNNELDASKLKREFPEMLSIKDSLIKYVFEPNKKTSA